MIQFQKKRRRYQKKRHINDTSTKTLTITTHRHTRSLSQGLKKPVADRGRSQTSRIRTTVENDFKQIAKEAEQEALNEEINAVE